MANSQVVHLAATPEGLNPVSASPFPPCGAITASDRFPASPSPSFNLITAQVQSVTPYSGSYTAGNASVNIKYQQGNMVQNTVIITTETAAAINSGMNA